MGSQSIANFLNIINSLCFNLLRVFLQVVSRLYETSPFYAPAESERQMEPHRILSGSYRKHLEGSVPAGQPPADQTLEITCVLRRRREVSAGLELKLSHEELAELHGADPADVEAVE